MLKIKVKEKLLNRLNELDVTEVVDSNGNHIAIEDLITYVESLEESDLIDILELISVDEVGNLRIRAEYVDFAQSYLKLDSLEGIVNDAEDSFFPSLTNQSGKVVKVNEDETGFEYGEVSGGTKLYKHFLVFNTGDELHAVTRFASQYTTLSEVVNDLSELLSAFCVTANDGSGFCLYIGPDYIIYYDGDIEQIRSLSNLTVVQDVVTPL